MCTAAYGRDDQIRRQRLPATKIPSSTRSRIFPRKLAPMCGSVRRGIVLDNRSGTKFCNSGPGFRRLLLPEGHQGARQDRASITMVHLAASSRRCLPSRPPQARHGAARFPLPTRQPARHDRVPCSVSPSTRHPTDMRDALFDSAGDSGCRLAPRVLAHRFGPVALRWRAANCPTSNSAAIPISRPRRRLLVVVTEWAHTARLDLEYRLKTNSRIPSWSTCATSIGPEDRPRHGFFTQASARPPDAEG